MTCPYSEPNCASALAIDAPRCLCGRYVKRCAECSSRNRAFANFCRGCGAAMPPSNTNWTGYRGNPRRLGTTPSLRGSDYTTRPPALRLRLGDACRALLGYDGHVVAVSVNGVVELADPSRGRSICRFQAQGPITAEPCIHDGVLYLATRGHLAAYGLAAMTPATPRVRPAWHLPLNGTPVQALTPVGERLFVTLVTPDRREIYAIEQQTARLLFDAPKLSWVAADPAGSHAVFLSEDGGRLQLHVIDHELTTYPVALQSFADHPIALLDGTVFGIFGHEHRLYRIDVDNGEVAEPLEADTQFFALTRHGDEWDRDGVRIDSGGIHFTRAGIHDSFAPHERVTKGSPVIVQGCAVAVGMEDGRVLLYDVAQLPRHEAWRFAGSSAAITALAAFDSYIAAGNREGVVEVRELVAGGAAS